MFRRTIRFTAATAICLAALQSPAWATDRKIYPGSTCVQWGGTGSATLSFSGIGNNSSAGDVLVDCPAVKDGGSTADAWMYMQDRSVPDDIDCTLIDAHTLTTDGTIYLETDHDTSGGGAQGSHLKVLFGSLATYDSSYKYFSCRIPPAYQGKISYIDSYSMNDN